VKKTNFCLLNTRKSIFIPLSVGIFIVLNSLALYDPFSQTTHAQPSINDDFVFSTFPFPDSSSLISSAHFFISRTLSYWIHPKSFLSILLPPMNLVYRKSVVTIGGVIIWANWLHATVVGIGIQFNILTFNSIRSRQLSDFEIAFTQKLCYKVKIN
jgi:hypothetical protein